MGHIYRLRLRRDRAELGPHSTEHQHTKFRERSNALHQKIKTWMSIQLLYNPQVSILRTRELAATRAGAPQFNPEDIHLWLPSAIAREVACDPKLQTYESQLRIAQANDALHEIRSGLLLRSHLWKFKNRFIRGQRANTRSQAVIDACQARIKVSIEKYQIARRALSTLSDILSLVGWQISLRELDEGRDVKGLTTSGFDEYDESMGRRELTWIWKSGNLSEPGLEGQESLQDGQLFFGHNYLCLTSRKVLRIEWCRTRARVMRFEEEVELLQEEMRRTLAFLQWQSAWWQDCRDESLLVSDLLQSAGTLAYAEKQTALRLALHDQFKHLWRYVEQWVRWGDDEVDGNNFDMDGGNVDQEEESDGGEDPFL